MKDIEKAAKEAANMTVTHTKTVNRLGEEITVATTKPYE